MSQTILYARVSTVDQTLEHQRAHAEAAGFIVGHVVADHGVSGVAVPLKERENGKRLFDMLRAGDVLVVRWVDRLGRDYRDVTDTIREFMRRGVVVRTVINGMTFDGATTDPVQQAVRDALIGFMAAMAQAQVEVSKEAQRAGIAHAKAEKGRKAYRGRKPTFNRGQFEAARALIESNAPAAHVAALCNVSRQTVHRFKSDPANCLAALERWGL